MSTNYFLVRRKRTDTNEILLGTQHVTRGKKMFTFILPIREMFLECINDYHDDTTIRQDGTNFTMSIFDFIHDVIKDCDIVHYEKGKP